MMHRSHILVVFIIACAQPPAPLDQPPAFDIAARALDSDLDTALRALQLLGANVPGATGTCKNCHAITRAGVRGWARSTMTALGDCLRWVDGDLGQTERERVACMRADPASSASPFTASRLGMFAAAAHWPKFQQVFRDMYSEDTWAVEYAKFYGRTAMPKSGAPMADADIDMIIEWMRRGVPKLDEALPEAGPPSKCVESYSDALHAHTADMVVKGWQAVNEENGILMQRLDGFPRSADTEYGRTWENGSGEIRVLKQLPARSRYWTRSSADGRFVASGGSWFFDLQNGTDILADAAYDPGFFPDNSGFVFQGTPIGTATCNQSLLTSGTNHVTFREPECSRGSIGLYQHLARGLDGGDYFVVNGQFRSDDSGHVASHVSDAGAGFSDASSATLTPMMHDGTVFTALPQLQVSTPWEGDHVLSPSGTLMINRLSGPGSRQLGYVIRKLDAQKTAAGYTATTTEVARVCMSGNKPVLSFDERFLAVHHFTERYDYAEYGFADELDPAIDPYITKGSSDLYAVDLTTGARKRLTRMGPGQFALFPHFRSDGWLYFLVRDANTGLEYVGATDGVLRMKQ